MEHPALRHVGTGVVASVCGLCEPEPELNRSSKKLWVLGAALVLSSPGVASEDIGTEVVASICGLCNPMPELKKLAMPHGTGVVASVCGLCEPMPELKKKSMVDSVCTPYSALSVKLVWQSLEGQGSESFTPLQCLKAKMRKLA